jgi:hypothetical protein
MSKKLMLLAAGVLSALAFAALPAIASAEELQVHCPTSSCIGSISGAYGEHAIRLENDKGERVEALNGVKGTIEIGAETTTTGTTALEFLHVVEKSSGFNFTCNSPGAATGVIKTGPLSTHFINLGTKAATIPAVLLTLPAEGITFSCAGGLVTKTVTGSVIGTITETKCPEPDAKNVVTFNIKAGEPKGTQEHELWTGLPYDLTSGPHPSDETTSAQTGRGNITWQKGNEPTITC